VYLLGSCVSVWNLCACLEPVYLFGTCVPAWNLCICLEPVYLFTAVGFTVQSSQQHQDQCPATGRYDGMGVRRLKLSKHLLQEAAEEFEGGMVGPEAPEDELEISSDEQDLEVGPPPCC
jgi:ribosomal protein S14